MSASTQPKMLLPQKMDILKALSTTPPVPDFVLPGLPVGAVGALIAPGAAGKTMLLLQVCAALAAGVPVLGGGLFSAASFVPAQPSKVVLVVAEETAEMMHGRLHAVVGELLGRLRPDLFNGKGGELAGLLAENLHLYPLAGRHRMLIDGSESTFDGLSALDKLSAGARLVVIDPLRQFHAGDENDPYLMTRMVQDLQMLPCTRTAAVLIAHHANKWSTTTGQGDRAGASRGSGAFTDAVRWQMNLSALDDDIAKAYGLQGEDARHHVRLDLAKANYLPPQEPMVLKRGQGGALTMVPAPHARASSKRGGRA
jgi:regulatory protein RepA